MRIFEASSRHQNVGTPSRVLQFHPVVAALLPPGKYSTYRGVLACGAPVGQNPCLLQEVHLKNEVRYALKKEKVTIWVANSLTRLWWVCHANRFESLILSCIVCMLAENEDVE